MATDKIENVAIIGAGLAGLSLAILLKQQGVRSTIYELRPPTKATYNAPLALTPNGLRSADAFGLYERMKPFGIPYRNVTSMSNENEKIFVREIGNSEKFGYDALRLYRQSVMGVVNEMIEEAGISIVYGKKFSHVVSETERDVTIAFTDGQQSTVDLLVGSDGLHSKVRKYILPDVKEMYLGTVAIAGIIPTSAIKLPFPDYPLPASIQGPGNVILAPLKPDGSECPIATQHPLEELDRQGWEALDKDKPRLREMMRQNYEKWNPTVQSALDAVDADGLYIWPFYTIPQLETWRSEKNRVVILGDSAHGVPPVGGLGANLAFEDAHAFALVLKAVNNGKISWSVGSEWWQEYRKVRIEGVKQLTTMMNKRRLGEAYDAPPGIDSNWLYCVDIEKDVREWIGN